MKNRPQNDTGTDQPGDCRRLTLEELFRSKRPQEWRAEYAEAYGWGPDLGREVVED